MNHSMITEKEFFIKLSALPFVVRIWLFGSRARGTNSSRSDVDLAIECPGATKNDWSQVDDIIENADTLLTIDCVRFDDMEVGSEFYKNIVKNRVLLYEKS